MKQKRTRTRGLPPTLIVKGKNGQDKTIQAEISTRLLGANIRRDLSWKENLETGERPALPKMRQQLGALNLIADQLLQKSRLNSANCLLISRVCYLVQVWGGSPDIYEKSASYSELGSKICVQTDQMNINNKNIMDKCNCLLVEELACYQ